MGSRSLSEQTSDEGGSESYLVDRTAGRLARWLRILGLDVEYAGTNDAAAIVRQARQSGRTVVTRNRALAARMGETGLLLSSERLGAQIRQVVERVGRDRCSPFTRCSTCNAGLVEVARDSVRGRVPDYVYRHHDRFASCPVCGRYYWRGTHWQFMQKEIEETLGGGHNGDR
jgi:uncharacterized protein with PIN domain